MRKSIPLAIKNRSEVPKFGVERSTISKILKHGEKYLSSDESGCSPVSIKRRRMADLRPALSSSAKREDHNNPRLKDAMILEKAQAFTSATNVPSQILTLGWVQRFRLQNDPAGARSPERSGSINGPKSFPAGGSIIAYRAYAPMDLTTSHSTRT
ncbi:hypothetical protein LTR35_018245, partial [Friedmanniomyces endolithicus]